MTPRKNAVFAARPLYCSNCTYFSRAKFVKWTMTVKTDESNFEIIDPVKSKSQTGEYVDRRWPLPCVHSVSHDGNFGPPCWGGPPLTLSYPYIRVTSSPPPPPPARLARYSYLYSRTSPLCPFLWSKCYLLKAKCHENLQREVFWTHGLSYKILQREDSLTRDSPTIFLPRRFYCIITIRY